MSDLVYLQTSNSSFAVGIGPFTKSSSPSNLIPSFYVTDFFQTLKEPWLIPSEFHQISHEELTTKFLKIDSYNHQKLLWNGLEEVRFRKFFEKIKSAINQCIIEKIVPVLFDTAELPKDWKGHTLNILTNKFSKFLNEGLFLHGYSNKYEGRCGLTPEILFSTNNKNIISFAIAGTKASMLGDLSLQNPKDSREHKIVVDDIAERLSKFNKITIGETLPLRLGTLIHLKTPISTILNQRQIDNSLFQDIARLLHPTAALGVYPRTDNAIEILKGSDIKLSREYWGAPFGIRYTNNDSFCVCSIRTVFWKEDRVRLGAGCGIIEESYIEDELEELRLKLQSVKAKLT